MTKNYFHKNLNYSMANEDTSLERSIVEKLRPERILSVCGSGTRAFPLLVDRTKELSLIDLSSTQLIWAGLRMKTIRNLSYNEYLEFWGLSKLPASVRKGRYYDLIREVDPRLLELFEENHWEAPIYFGQWEKTYLKLSKIVRLFLGHKNLKKLNLTTRLEEQKSVVNSFSFRLRWGSVLFIVGSRTLFNALLYKGQFIRKNIDESYVDFYKNSFKRLFNNHLLRNSFFLQLSFNGSLLEKSSFPCEAQSNVFDNIKSNLKIIEPLFLNTDLIQHLETSIDMYDFISMSDVPSYFDSPLGSSFLQKARHGLKHQGVVVVRYYLRVHKPDTEGFEDITDTFSDTINKEGVQVYKVKVYRRIS